jgi:hypothetical protein
VSQIHIEMSWSSRNVVRHDAAQTRCGNGNPLKLGFCRCVVFSRFEFRAELSPFTYEVVQDGEADNMPGC